MPRNFRADKIASSMTRTYSELQCHANVKLNIAFKNTYKIYVVSILNIVILSSSKYNINTVIILSTTSEAYGYFYDIRTYGYSKYNASDVVVRITVKRLQQFALQLKYQNITVQLEVAI